MTNIIIIIIIIFVWSSENVYFDFKMPIIDDYSLWLWLACTFKQLCILLQLIIIELGFGELSITVVLRRNENENHSVMIISLQWNRKLSMRFSLILTSGLLLVPCVPTCASVLIKISYFFHFCSFAYNACPLNLFKSKIQTNTKDYRLVYLWIVFN